MALSYMLLWDHMIQLVINYSPSQIQAAHIQQIGTASYII